MRPALVLPLHDPAGTMLPLLQAITPTLKTLFQAVYLGITQRTGQHYTDQLKTSAADPFFVALHHTQALPVGEQFRALYHFAATQAPPEQLLHLAFIDRIAFALQTAHRARFVEDMTKTAATDAPILFARSPSAWQTHPHNYYQLETMITDVGKMVLGRRLDFAWCHLALRAADLQQIVQQLQCNDLTLCAEITLLLAHHIEMVEVDWLAWEDPYILGRDAEELRREREASPSEVAKRLGYVVPMLQLLQQAAATKR